MLQLLRAATLQKQRTAARGVLAPHRPGGRALAFALSSAAAMYAAAACCSCARRKSSWNASSCVEIPIRLPTDCCGRKSASDPARSIGSTTEKFLESSSRSVGRGGAAGGGGAASGGGARSPGAVWARRKHRAAEFEARRSISYIHTRARVSFPCVFAPSLPGLPPCAASEQALLTHCGGDADPPRPQAVAAAV